MGEGMGVVGTTHQPDCWGARMMNDPLSCSLSLSHSLSHLSPSMHPSKPNPPRMRPSSSLPLPRQILMHHHGDTGESRMWEGQEKGTAENRHSSINRQ